MCVNVCMGGAGPVGVSGIVSVDEVPFGATEDDTSWIDT